MIKIKRTIFAAAIIIFALAFGAAALYIIDDTKTSITCIINDIERSVENKNYNKAHELSNKLNEYWQSREEILVYFVRHHELDELTSAASRLPHLIKHGDVAEFTAECEKILTLINHIMESEMPYLKNIL